MPDRDEAKANILTILPYIRYAVSEAKKNGTPKLGILCEFPDGRGKIEASFDVEFLNDLAILVDAPAQTEEDNLTAAARQISDMINKNQT